MEKPPEVTDPVALAKKQAPLPPELDAAFETWLDTREYDSAFQAYLASPRGAWDTSLRMAASFMAVFRMAFAAGAATLEPEARLVRALHARLAHPDYEYETTKAARKCGPPDPAGEGWEVNEDHCGGFERFDYHEEQYWRRVKKEGE